MTNFQILRNFCLFKSVIWSYIYLIIRTESALDINFMIRVGESRKVIEWFWPIGRFFRVSNSSNSGANEFRSFWSYDGTKMKVKHKILTTLSCTIASPLWHVTCLRNQRYSLCTLRGCLTKSVTFTAVGQIFQAAVIDRRFHGPRMTVFWYYTRKFEKSR